MQTKKILKPTPLVYPAPAILVSCGFQNVQNIITISWTGTINSVPPMCSISIRPERFSHSIIKDSGEFVINLTTKEQAFAADWCGIKSGRDFDKFKEMNFTPGKSIKLQAPIISECPINIECKVQNIVSLGSHDMFIAEIVAVQVDESILDSNTQIINWNKLDLLSYFGGHYYEIGKQLGKSGFSIKGK